MEDAFAVGAGFAASELNILIRSMIASLIVFWGIWAIWKQYIMYCKKKLDADEWGGNTIKITLLMILVLIIVGI